MQEDQYKIPPVHPEVILVDDNNVDNFIHQRVLSFYRFAEKITAFTSPLQAIEHLKEAGRSNGGVPTFLFLDLSMPIMNGFEFMKAFAKLPSRVRSLCKVVILSNSMNPADLSEAVKDPNIFAYLSKPLIKTNLDELNGLIVSSRNKK